jgi:UDP-3-O-[3-hydroxymyristoyl] glucosamine N-acyltransferase
MADPRFYEVAGPFSLMELAEISGGTLFSDTNGEAQFSDVAPLNDAGPSDVSFLDNIKYVEIFSRSSAGAVIVRPAAASKAPIGMQLIMMDNPYHGYARVARAFYPKVLIEKAILKTACFDETALVGDSCRIDHGVVIGANVTIGNGCWIGANSVVCAGVSIGNDTHIGPNVTLESCLIGSQVIIHAGARIGQDGFGFAMGPKGHLKVPQLGRVIVEDEVEIGANTTIDRGTGPDTIIGAGSKIDNLVQIGHNVHLGRGCVVVSQVGISGSTVIGEFCVIGGQVGIAGHLKIGPAVQVAAQSGIMRNVAPGEKICGSPARPIREFMRGVVAIDKMSKKRGM